MVPKPWSHSALSDFENCPRAFCEKRVTKSVVETKGEATIWGEQVHKHFEDRLVDGVVLPPALEKHEKFLSWIEAQSGKLTVEERIALDTRVRPCEFFGQDVWFRGVIDAKIVNGAVARIVDHKTGKHHNKFGQLKLFGLHTFAAHPEVTTVIAGYYWTQTEQANWQTYTRDEVPKLWAEFLPALRQYSEAFRTDTWQPRQSGLCNGWCPVVDCEFWQPKRKRG